MAIKFIDLEKTYATIPRETTMGTLRWVGVPEGEVRLVEGTYEDMKWTGSVRRVQSKCWPDTRERFDPIVVYRCGGTDKQKYLYKRHSGNYCTHMAWQ